MNKTAVIGLVLIAIMFGSSIAFAALQSVTQTQTQAPQVKLPESYIVRSDIPESQEFFILQNQKTLLKYSYPSNCLDCNERIGLLEALATNSVFTSKIYLEEIVGEAEKLEIVSALGGITLDGSEINVNSTVDELCRFTISPPVDCTFR